MPAGTYNLCIDQGSTFIRVFTWTTTEGTCSCGSSCGDGCGCGTSSNTSGGSCVSSCDAGTPVDVTGYTADMQIRQTIASSTILYEASTANGAIVMGTTDGTITLTIPATDTANFTWNRGVYDLNMTSPTGVVTRLLQGYAIVSPEVTR